MSDVAMRYFRLGVVLVFAILAFFIAYNYFTYGGVSVMLTLFLVFGTVLGIVFSRVLYNSFLERERQMAFAPGEDVILQRKYPEKSVVIPQVIGSGDSPHAAPDEVNLYLTNIGIIAEPPGLGEPILYIPFSDIHEMQTVNRMLAKYIRIRYIDINDMPAEVLLYVGGDTDVWAENIGRMMLR